MKQWQQKGYQRKTVPEAEQGKMLVGVNVPQPNGHQQAKGIGVRRNEVRLWREADI